MAVTVVTAAQRVHAIIDELIQNWVLDNTAYDMCAVGQDVTNVYLVGLGFKPEKKSLGQARRRETNR